MDCKQFERKNFVVGNINIKYEELQQLPDQIIHILTLFLHLLFHIHYFIIS
jgi:hypothetical protein